MFAEIQYHKALFLSSLRHSFSLPFVTLSLASVPFHCEVSVALHPTARRVHVPQLALRFRQALFGGLPEPLHRSAGVARHPRKRARVFEENQAQRALRGGEPTVGRLPQ